MCREVELLWAKEATPKAQRQCSNSCGTLCFPAGNTGQLLCVSKSQGAPAAAPGQGADLVSALQSRWEQRETQGCSLHTLKMHQLQRFCSTCPPSPWNTSTHTQTAAPQLLGRDTGHPHCRAVGNVTRKKQRSSRALLRSSVSVNARGKVQVWLIPGVHKSCPTPHGQTHL